MAVLDYIIEMFVGIFTNAAIVIPTVSWIVAQIIKTIVYLVMFKKLDWSRLFGDGGMPSAHSATVSSLAIIVGHACGYGSAEFGLAIMFAIVVMHDALGVRRETGKQAESLLTIADVIKNYVDELDINLKTEKLKVLVGHTPLQVVLGSALGVSVAFIYIGVFRGLLGIGFAF